MMMRTERINYLIHNDNTGIFSPPTYQLIDWRKGGRELWVLGEGSEVDVWDLGERRCVARWKDQGGFGGRLLKGSRNGDYCAVA